jgi:hypothetical protein
MRAPEASKLFLVIKKIRQSNRKYISKWLASSKFYNKKGRVSGKINKEISMLLVKLLYMENAV